MRAERILNLTLNEAEIVTFFALFSYFRMRTFYSPNCQKFCQLVKRLEVVVIVWKVLLGRPPQGTAGEEVKQEAFLMTSFEHLDPATPEANNP